MTSAELDFHGQTAIITGAGSGLGRSYAHLLASRGAQVVVNDLGHQPSTQGNSLKRAEKVAAEIIKKGGKAVAHVGDISDENSVQALTQLAIEHFGRIDIVINNAGMEEFVSFSDITSSQFKRFIDVHLFGSFLATKAAWPYLVQQNYGRVIFTSSSTAFGMPYQAHYAAAKTGVLGLANTLSFEGQPHNINVNTIMPIAATPIVANPHEMPKEVIAITAPVATVDASPDLVAPVIAWLAHKDCPVSGQIMHVGCGWVGRMLMTQSFGYADSRLSIEAVRDHWAEISEGAPRLDIPDCATAVKSIITAVQKSASLE